MASLGEVLGAIISQVGKGRSQADMATLEVAKIYKDHPPLSGFPIPKMTLDEVVIDLKMAITTVPAPKTLTPEAKEQVLSRLDKVMDDLLVAEPSLDKVRREFPNLLKVGQSTRDQLKQRLSDLLPVKIEVEPQSIAYGMASAIRGHLTSMVFAVDEKVMNKNSKIFLQREVPQIETKLAPQIQEAISKVLEIQPADKNQFDILVTASDLQPIPPEKITNVKLILREADQTWTQIETEKGEVKNKLIQA